MCIWWNIIFILLQRFYPVDLCESLHWMPDVLSSEKSTLLIIRCSPTASVLSKWPCTELTHLLLHCVFFRSFLKKASCLQPKRSALRFDFDCSFDLSFEDPSTSLKPFLKTKNQTRKSLNNRTHPPWFLPSWRLYRPQSIACGSLIEDPMVFLNREENSYQL